MDRIDIRPACVADAPIIAQAIVMAMGEECAALLCGPEYMKVLEQVAMADGTQYSFKNALIAEVDGVAVGAAAGYDGARLSTLRDGTLAVISRYYNSAQIPEDETGVGEFYIDFIGVLPQWRGCGVGKRLTIAMVGKGLVQECGKVGLLLDFGNSGAAALYSQFGFQPVGEKLFFGHKMRHLQCSHLPAVGKIQYTGLNYPQVQEFCGDKILAPYICMGFSMLSLLVPDGFMTVNEGDTICKDGLGNFWVE